MAALSKANGRDDGARLRAALRTPVLIALAVGLAAVAVLAASHDPARSSASLLTAAAATLAAVWAMVAAVVEPLRCWREFRRVPRQVLGMAFAHLGVGVTALGITFVSALGVERDVALSIGTPVEVAGRRFEVIGFDEVAGPNYNATRAQIRVTRGDGSIVMLTPEKRTYSAGGMPMSEAAIDPGPLRDLYVALGEPIGNGAWAMRVQVKPLVRWIWSGALLMALGGLLALSAGWRGEAR